MAFKFRLEQVLSYRKQLEEQAMQTHSVAITERDAVKRHIDQVAELLANVRQILVNPVGMSSGERWVARSSETAYLAELDDLRLVLEEKELHVESTRQVLIAKAQERELLDKLKEKQAIKYFYEQRLLEQRNNDETATLRFKPATI